MVSNTAADPYGLSQMMATKAAEDARARSAAECAHGQRRVYCTECNAEAFRPTP